METAEVRTFLDLKNYFQSSTAPTIANIFLKVCNFFQKEERAVLTVEFCDDLINFFENPACGSYINDSVLDLVFGERTSNRIYTPRQYIVEVLKKLRNEINQQLS